MLPGMPTLPFPLLFNFGRSTLTCISSGGPATTILWSRDNYNALPSNTQQQQLINTVNATYYNHLTITSSNIRDYTGKFRCRVSNSRGTSFPRSMTTPGS